MFGVPGITNGLAAYCFCESSCLVYRGVYYNLKPDVRN